MKSHLMTALIAATMLVGAPSVWAQDEDMTQHTADSMVGGDSRPARQRLHRPDVSPEERQAMREQWQSMSAEERTAWREERRARREAMSPATVRASRNRRDDRAKRRSRGVVRRATAASAPKIVAKTTRSPAVDRRNASRQAPRYET